MKDYYHFLLKDIEPTCAVFPITEEVPSDIRMLVNTYRFLFEQDAFQLLRLRYDNAVIIINKSVVPYEVCHLLYDFCIKITRYDKKDTL